MARIFLVQMCVCNLCNMQISLVDATIKSVTRITTIAYSTNNSWRLSSARRCRRYVASTFVASFAAFVSFVCWLNTQCIRSTKETIVGIDDNNTGRRRNDNNDC